MISRLPRFTLPIVTSPSISDTTAGLEGLPVDFEVKITDEDIRNEWKMSDDTERKKENNENV